MIKSEILTPLLNTNEPEARLVSIHVKDGQAVSKGLILFTIETTKSTEDIESPEQGFIRLFAGVGDILAVGDRIAVITEKEDEKIDAVKEKGQAASPGGGLRITNPARSLAESLGLDLASLPTDRLITEEMVRQLTRPEVLPDIILPETGKPYIVVFGGGGHAKTLMDMIWSLGSYEIAGIVDDRLPAGTVVMGKLVLGSRAVLPTLLQKNVELAANGVGGIVDIGIRVRIFDFLQASGFNLPALVHPRATIEASAVVKEGVQVFANAYVGSEAVLFPMCMVNTNAVVSHDCVIGSYTHIAPGALLAGHVKVGERTLVGMGVTTAIGVEIGSGVRIGNAATVLADVPDRTIIQAGRYWVGKPDRD
jgi:sugar O-acyltransferase (sialic acid O-acetyltransferase NeuD family)